MTDYEHIITSAVRYALGRMTYIVSLTVDYVLRDINNHTLSQNCLESILRDIEHTKKLGMDCDIKEWNKLKNRIKQELNK